MPSTIHQKLIGLIARKMQQFNFEIIAMDGKDYSFDGVKLTIPPTILRHRPDLLGIHLNTKTLCVGEAKTTSDLKSKRTKEQLEDYSQVRTLSNNEPLRIIIGIPQSAVNDLESLIRMNDRIDSKHLTYVWLPEELVD